MIQFLIVYIQCYDDFHVFKVSTIEVPSDYISILEVENENKNNTFKCQATNSLGTHTDHIEVVTNIFFNVLETPKGKKLPTQLLYQPKI